MPRARYSRLHEFVARVNLTTDNPWDDCLAHLIDGWLIEYDGVCSSNEIVTTRAGDFWYLFDVQNERLIAAFGFSQGKHTGPRDKGRMRDFPLSNGPLFHRGHAIPHTLGGPTDINLVPQLGSLNIGEFRILENTAVKLPGSLYFTYWRYANPHSQTPTSVDQGLLTPPRTIDVRTHHNSWARPRPAHVAAFIKLILPAAQRVNHRWRVPVSVTIAQAALESGWGTKVVGNAYLGVKGKPLDRKTVAIDTTEVINGSDVKLRDNFRAYGNLDAAVEDYGKLLNTRRYAAAFLFVNNPMRFVDEVARAGYATRVDYAARLKAVIRSERLMDFDE